MLKKVLIMAITAALILSVPACGSTAKDTNESPETKEQATDEASADEKSSDGEEAKAGDKEESPDNNEEEGTTQAENPDETAAQDGNSEDAAPDVTAAVSYAESYQHIPEGAYSEKEMPPTTEQAVIMLASHFYESRDGSTGGFFADNTNAAQQVWNTVNLLLRLDREWKV